MNASLRRTWLRLTAWYVGVFAVVMIAFGAGLYVAVTREISHAVNHSLEEAVTQARRALEIRERERDIMDEKLVDALDEMHVPGHDLYYFDSDVAPIRPLEAPEWIGAAAAQALGGGSVRRSFETADGTWRLFARRFDVAGNRYVVVAATDALAIDRQYPAIFRAFLLAGLGALLLVALGGSLLARKSLVPVQGSMDRMRRFVADASHELRTPAAVLRATAEVGLQRPRSGDEYARLLTTLRDESERLGRLVEGLLLLASADDGRLRIRRDHVFLDDLLVDASNAARALASEQGVSIRVGSFDEAPVLGDPVLLRQLLLIVLDNAIKFSPPDGVVEGSVIVRGDRACAQIVDSGPGIASEHLPYVFERFYRADPGRSGGGAGIGLSIASVIAEAHDATIRIDSSVGTGTTVGIELPLATAPEASRPRVAAL